jgi:(4S)-4-hydroxy-5-phosphonooxypentane-2,3-dione isomerase
MGNFALVVDMEVKPEDADRFATLIAENARLSVANEPGCLQFDVVRPQDAPGRFMLYEVYENAAAFEAHIKMPHVGNFFGQAKPLIVSQKATRTERAAANRK